MYNNGKSTKINQNYNLTQLDANQIVNRKFDESHDADRVVIVGGADLKFEVQTDQITNAIKEGFNTIQPKQTEKQIEIKEIEKIVFIPQIEIKEVEKQIFVPVIEYKTIEIPVITEKIITIEKPIFIPQIVEIEKQIIVKEIEYKEVIKERYYPMVLKVCAIIQALGVIILLTINLLKK